MKNYSKRTKKFDSAASASSRLDDDNADTLSVLSGSNYARPVSSPDLIWGFLDHKSDGEIQHLIKSLHWGLA